MPIPASGRIGSSPRASRRLNPSAARPIAASRSTASSKPTVQTVPEVRGAALVNTLPLTGSVAKRSVELEGYTVPPSTAAPLFWMHAITPDYFRVMDIRLELGRAFTPADLSGRPAVVIVTAATARRFWPGQQSRSAGTCGSSANATGTPWSASWRTCARSTSTSSVPGLIDGAVYLPQGPNATLEDGRIPTEMTIVVERLAGSRNA